MLITPINTNRMDTEDNISMDLLVWDVEKDLLLMNRLSTVEDKFGTPNALCKIFISYISVVYVINFYSRCSQCFQPFPDGIYFEFEGKKYCEHDFHVLYAPCCGKCNEFIVGRVIKAMNANWHPDCFTCELCDKKLADIGFLRNAGRSVTP